ncbi:AAA family ATPase [Myroides odoratimimus]|uniref:ATPase AAA-type core domain-containing protein n=1 Tax=Myroides odoratimimus CIP 101113 TaxID=883154 RepID=A0AAV3F3A9_9FLAO|nr:AAA family ATPase [Myroides odoratimimus]EHO12578.1 hypothetical protein HMPREF9715_01733 [Myroides odoratimimus CIP 101113]
MLNTDLTSLIVGQNGLGKSNLLEALSLIFIAIDSNSNDDEVTLSSFENKYFNFDLKYKLKGKSINICYGVNKAYYFKIDDFTYQFLDYNKVRDQLKKDLLPDYVVAYYSGQNKRLEKIYNNFEYKYINGLKKNQDNEKLTDLRKFIYLKKSHGPLLLLTFSIFSEFQSNGRYIYKEYFDKLLSYLKIEKIDNFAIKICSPYWVKYINDEDEEQKKSKGHVSYIHETLEDITKYPNPFWNLKSSLNLFFRALAYTEDIVPYTNEEEDDFKRSNFREYIDIHNVKINEISVELFKNFKSPLELFYTLEALYFLEMVDEEGIKFSVTKNTHLDINYDMLSEGENQLFIVLSSVLMTGNEETLFLLDEPDTYLNPRWQREYVNLLEDFNLEDDDSHIFVTTHSPLLVQNIEGENKYKYDLLLLYQDLDGNVCIDSKNGIIENWRLDQVLLSKYFNIESTRPLRIDEFMKERINVIQGKFSKEEAQRRLKEFDKKTIGYLPSGESMIEIESLKFLYELAQSKNDKT